jgi:hypothetical protein
MPATSRKAAPEPAPFAPAESVVHGRKPQNEEELWALERELLAIERRYDWSKEDERRHKEISGLLKGIQPKGTSHRDTFEGLGDITVHGYGDAELGRDVYEVDMRKIDAMTDAEREKELARGLIKRKTPAARSNYGKIETNVYNGPGSITAR